MNDEVSNPDCCAMCAKPVARERACHVYRNGIPVTLCGPACVQDFMLGASDSGGGENRGMLTNVLARSAWSSGR